MEWGGARNYELNWTLERDYVGKLLKWSGPCPKTAIGSLKWGPVSYYIELPTKSPRELTFGNLHLKYFWSTSECHESIDVAPTVCENKSEKSKYGLLGDLHSTDPIHVWFYTYRVISPVGFFSFFAVACKPAPNNIDFGLREVPPRQHRLNFFGD